LGGTKNAFKGIMKRPKILIVEDDQDIRALCQEILEDEGYVVSVCANGQDAMEYLEVHRQPNLILLDMMMPVMNGREFMAAYRESQGTSVKRIAPVYLVSASAAKSEVRDLGCKGFLRKPFDFDALMNIVRTHCASGQSELR
jgi:CheY-like chemotaxis protein